MVRPNINIPAAALTANRTRPAKMDSGSNVKNIITPRKQPYAQNGASTKNSTHNPAAARYLMANAYRRDHGGASLSERA
jgi:hypothetical protein